MSQELRADYQSQLLFPPCLEDWIPADHPSRFIREFVDAQDLAGLGFSRREEGEPGRPNYSADLLLKVWLYGYLNRIRSSRGLERACGEHLSLIWLTGGHMPDHNTLWRFWRDHTKALRRLFGQAVQVCVKAGLVGMAFHAVDGTKIQARSSTRRHWKRKELEALLARVEASLQGMEEAVERSEKKEKGEYRLPASLQDREQLRQRIRESLARLGPSEGSEPEAKLMKGEGGVRLSYNAQAVVDEKTGIVVAEKVVTDGSDNHQLVPMLEKTQEQLGAVAEQTVADGGYSSGESLLEAQQKKFEVLVNLPPEMRRRADKPFASCNFRHDAERDCCICPQGEVLPLSRVRQRPEGYSVREYRCKSFLSCPVRAQCSRDRQGRRVEISPHQGAVEWQRQKREDPSSRDLFKRRMATVEPVFGWAKEGLGFRRFTSWGLEAAGTQWAMLCTVLNLKKLYRPWKEGKVAFA